MTFLGQPQGGITEDTFLLSLSTRTSQSIDYEALLTFALISTSKDEIQRAAERRKKYILVALILLVFILGILIRHLI
jgi:hypothetical protein